MKKIAIVGANGYIARNLIYTLKEQEPQIEAVLYSHSEFHEDIPYKAYQMDLLDKDSIRSMDLDCDAVFFFVGKTGSTNGFDEYEIFLDRNERALLAFLNECRRQKSKAKIIFPSTRLVYKGSLVSQAEDAETELKTIYAVSKFACEQYLKQYHNVFGLNYCICRICLPYGTLVPAASSYGTVEFMLNKASRGENICIYGDGSARRTVTYIGDICKALIQVADSDKCMNDTFNIGGENYSLKEMAELISAKYNVGIEYTDYPAIAKKTESGDTVFDDSKIKTVGISYHMAFEKWLNI